MTTISLPNITARHTSRQVSIESLTSDYSLGTRSTTNTSGSSIRGRKRKSSQDHRNGPSHDGGPLSTRGSFSSHRSRGSESSIDSQDTCVVSRLSDNTPLEDMASFCTQNKVVGSLWECCAFTSDLPDLPDSILFLTFSIRETRVKKGTMMVGDGGPIDEEATRW